MTDLATLRGIVQRTADAALDAGTMKALDVAQTVRREHDDLVQSLGDELALTAIVRMIKQLMRAETEGEDGQLSLFGFPAVLAIPTPTDEYVYMRSTQATWDSLVAARALRADNVTRAQRKLDIYDEALDKVRPLMHGTQLTLADAIAQLGEPE